ncbi:translation machinery-associated protein 16-like [Mercenaria mercenaria]|uniref:translation machinery-associated protein 16-like n=1 Tax=Mercenaria mercenaria TaxID=6596 RepID=UPI00234EA33F|nr:translation machinery-associated protein 16-like [Mercenaria mercenaria]XP_045211722.2 translation machinery-associated protein 16-like [Mercenaria mercenaria]
MPKAPKTVTGKSKKVVHPNSRHATYIQRKINREQRLMKNKAESTIKQEQLQQKLLWYQTNLDSQKSMYTKHELAELTSKYLERFDEELEQIGIVNAVGNRQAKQHQARETAIKLTKERENLEFDTIGIEVPDLINGKNLEYFRNWTGEIRYFPNIKLRKSKRSDLKTSVEEHIDESENTEELPDYVDSLQNEDNDIVSTSDELPDYVDADTS